MAPQDRHRRGTSTTGAEYERPEASGGSPTAYRVAYDGREYAGFQRQPEARTVEGTLLRALAKLDVIGRGDGPTHSTPPGYAAAGRTDAGVSALSQTISFSAPAWLTPRAFNGRLPEDIRVWAAAEVPNGFHATHDATSRTYRYYLLAPDEGENTDDVKGRIVVDDARVRTAIDRVGGEHDFRNLTADERGTVRTVSPSVTRDGDVLVIEVTAGGFPRSLVRRLVELIRLVGVGSVELEFVDRVLESRQLPGGLGVGAAAPEPLVLWDVEYEDVTFRVDEEAAERACTAFEERNREARRMASVTAAIRDGIGR